MLDPSFDADLTALTDGPTHAFTEWRQTPVPRHGAGVYTIWNDAGQLIYVGMSGRTMTADTAPRATPYGLFTRLASHASGRRSGDQFCVYVSDRLVLPRLSADEIAAIGAGTRSMDQLVWKYIHDHLTYRYVVVADGTTAFRLEALIRSGKLGQAPLLNPMVPK